MSIGQRFGFALLFVWALITGVAFCTGGLLMAFTGSLDEGPLIGKADGSGGPYCLPQRLQPRGLNAQNSAVAARA